MLIIVYLHSLYSKGGLSGSKIIRFSSYTNLIYKLIQGYFRYNADG